MNTKRIGLFLKEKIIEEIENRKNNSSAYIFVSFSQTRAFPLNIIRNRLKSVGASFLVAKNTLWQRAFKEKDLSQLLNGQSGVIFVDEDKIVDTCKVLVNFSKENETFKIKGGFLKEKRFQIKEIEELVKLPGREVLLGIAVSSLVAPLTNFVSTLNQIIVSFLLVLEELRKKKEAG